MKFEINHSERIDNFGKITKINTLQRIFLFGRTYEDGSQLNVFINLEQHIYIHKFGVNRMFFIWDKDKAEDFYMNAAAEKGEMKYEYTTHYR